jgi:hypothetical protein
MSPDFWSAENLAKLTPEQILKLRHMMAGNLGAQNKLAPVDHRMFTRDAAATEGPLAALGIGMVSPFYQLKKLGNYRDMQYVPEDPEQSEPSWDQFIQGYQGLAEGLGDWGKRKKNKLAELFGTKESGLSHQMGLKEKQKAFINKLRMAPREQQLQFMAEQLSTGIPDTEVRHQLPIERNEQEPLADMLYAQRKKVEAMSRRPL